MVPIPKLFLVERERQRETETERERERMSVLMGCVVFDGVFVGGREKENFNLEYVFYKPTNFCLFLAFI